MKKREDYKELQRAGLPVPKYGVFEDSCLTVPDEQRRLRELISDILHNGSGYVGVRTEPKRNRSPLGSYPHLMPLTSFDSVMDGIRTILSEFGPDWCFLINEAFTNYVWNAVVMARTDQPVVGGVDLQGEVNLEDNLPLREALAHPEKTISAGEWQEGRRLGRQIVRSGLLNKWLEVSKVLDHGTQRIVFWGMR